MMKVQRHGATALVLGDLQNDFLHAKGAYARGGASCSDILALPQRLKPLVEHMRKCKSLIVSTHFTLVPGIDGEPLISPHLAQLRPFLRRGDFAPGSWGHALIDELSPSHVSIEKIAYSAFYMTRLEWILRKLNIEQLLVAGIVTNGGVASTVRDAHVRDFEVTVLEDGCAAFSQEVHRTSISALAPVARVASISNILDEMKHSA
ncbi:MAG: cysteine hydrolase [Alphaproteobacteria bacterium]|nr:cysteine hydrolase [Alphaproteobacteria bacterium]